MSLERSFQRKRERRWQGLPELAFRDMLAAGMPEGMAHYAARIVSFGARGCWESARRIAGDKRDPKRFPGELPPGKRGQHHPNSIPRWKKDPRFQEFFESTRFRPLERIPDPNRDPKNQPLSRHGGVYVVFLPARRAAERKRQHERSKIPPGLLEHEARKVTNAEEALAVLGWSSRGPPT